MKLAVVFPRGEGERGNCPSSAVTSSTTLTTTNPPFVHLTPDTVRQASAFLSDVSFDVLWESAGPKLHATFGPGWAEEDVRDICLRHHADLRGFYQRTATAGKAVVKAFWY
ncbi:DUF1877 family protein [Streptomyces sp. NPDC001450]